MIPSDRTHAAPSADPTPIPRISEEQKQLLAERLAEVERDPGVLVPAEEVEAELRALLASPRSR